MKRALKRHKIPKKLIQCIFVDAALEEDVGAEEAFAEDLGAEEASADDLGAEEAFADDLGAEEASADIAGVDAGDGLERNKEPVQPGLEAFSVF